MNLLRKQAGDTIVEVLIAMTVAAGVLGSSYTVVNRTMANAQQAQEHSEALEIANKQVEYIAALASSPSAASLMTGHPYKCVDKNSGLPVNQIQINSLADIPISAKYMAACISDGSIQYLTAINYNAPTKLFTVYVTWANAIGSGNDQVKLVYKAYTP